ncbi:DUF1330 domain-containing protein [Hydrogenophaga sp. SNF1]|jgi:uncharacterized protein (DUF1330 family)|uniref:DUF1330 domain-containing protein n=1 Tax=Hydrogenophaga sp. SNF1 TaxID=3098762 RepID=UPI002ACC2CDA|nr:DUF1330 domain-containing protein [Hydrogenophaga sp. SNF1]WQB83426.1 DUF1330 domain-containing protein [Hydrogenophaga sp. SNF1]
MRQDTGISLAQKDVPVAVYVVAQLKFKNRLAYDRYKAAFGPVFRKYAGQVLAADEAPRVEEGSWSADKVVLISFPDEPTYRIWADSPEYQEIAKDRREGAECVVLLLKGVPA